MLTAWEQHLLAGYLANVTASLHHRSEEASALGKRVAHGKNRTAFETKRRRHHRRR